MKLLKKTTATLLIALFLVSITAITAPVLADTIEHSEEWNPFVIRSQDVADRVGVVSVDVSGLSVSGDLYVGNTLTLSGTVDMTADPGIHAWWIHQAWACSWGDATLTGPGVHYYYPSSFKWADGYILSGWWWNIIPNDQSQTWDFSFEFTPTEAGTYTLKAFGHADAGYYREHYDSENPGWSWSDSDNQVDSITFEVTVVPTILEAVEWIADNVAHHGLANSLISKLENVQDRNFEKILNAFINEVDAQSDKKVPLYVTEALIEWAIAWSANPELAY